MRSGGSSFHRRRQSGRGVFIAVILTAMGLFTAPSGAENGVLRSRVYKFRHIPAAQGIELLERLELCQVSKHSSSVIVFTSDVPVNLIKASSILELMDRTEAVEFKVLMEPSAHQPLPVVSELLELLKGQPVGTLMDPPTKGTANAGIVDILNDRVIALAGTETMAKIETALTGWQQAHKRPSSAVEPNQPVAEKPAVAAAEPNQLVVKMPAAAVAEPNQAEPAEKPQEPTPVEVKLPAAPVEPNALAVGSEEKAAIAAVKPQAAAVKAVVSEPNQTVKEEPSKPIEEDFFSEELLKTLVSAEEKTSKVEPQVKAAAQEPNEQAGTAKPKAVEKPVETEKEEQPLLPAPDAVEPKVQTPTAEEQAKPAESAADEDAHFKQIVEALMKQAAKDETAAAQAETAEQPVSEKLPQEAKPVEPVVAEKTPQVLPQPEAPAEKADETAAAQAETAKQPVSEKLPEAKPVEPAVVEKTPQVLPQPEAPAEKMTEQPVAQSEAEKIQKTAGQTTIPQGEKELELTITLPEKVDIVALLELVGKQLGLNYMYDPVKVRGDVMLKIHDGKIKVKDTYALLESVMRFRGFAMTRRGSLVTIVPLAEAIQSDPTLRRPDEPMKPGDVIVSSVFELKYVNINNAQNILRQMNLGTVYIPIPETNTLIVTDYAYRMERITEILRMIDVPGEPKEFMFRQLQFMQASEILPKIQQLAAQLENVAVRLSVRPQTATQIDPRTRQPVQAPGAPGQPQTGADSRQMVFLDPDDRTNRLFMIGYAEQVRIVNELIDSLDVRQYSLRYVKEYPIKNVDASEVVSVLNELSLAKVSVSKPTTATQSRQTMPVRPGQPVVPGQPVPQPQTSTATTVSGGADQPYIAIRAATNSLLVNATAEQHEAIELVISYVDVEQKDKRTINEYEIQSVDAGLIVQTLGNLGIISAQAAAAAAGTSSAGTSAVRGGGSAVSYGQPQQGMQGMQGMEGAVSFLPTAGGETVTELAATEPQIAVLDTTNSLLVFATPRQHAAIALVIAHVDRQLDRMTTPYVVYSLENQKPADLAKVLNDLIKETVPEQAGPSSPDAKIQTRPTAAATTTSPSREEEKIRIIPDEISYSLIVFANKKNQQWVAAIIKELDQYRPQVLLDCTLVEVTKQDDFNYDLNIIHSIPDLTNTSGFTDNLVSGTTPVTKDSILTKLNAATDRKQFIDMQSDSGRFTGFYGNEKVMALLTAMQTKKYGRILANPKILVDDNQEGTIETKSTTYITRTSSTNIPGEGGQVVTTQNTEFEPYDASISLVIKPHISKGDNLRLEIAMIRSDFVNFSAASLEPPDKAESNVKTVVTVPDNSTIILGGMDRINQTKGGSKVPILGDIPLVGGLFRSTDNLSTQNKLYIFVKPHILRPGKDLANEDVKRISETYRKDFETKESEMQRYDDWPGIKPKPMDPPKILEDDEYIEKLKKQQEEGNVVTVPIN